MGKLSLFRIHRSRRWFFRWAIWSYGLKFKAREWFLFHVSLNLHLLYCIFFSFFFSYLFFTVDISFLLLRRFSICFTWICCVWFNITYIIIHIITVHFKLFLFIGDQWITCALLLELYFVTINTMSLCDRFLFEALLNFNN